LCVDKDLRCSFDVLKPLDRKKFLKVIKEKESKGTDKNKFAEENLRL
jgi:hypothetical protein